MASARKQSRIPKTEAGKGALLAFANAQRLQDAAEATAERAHFGPAVALCVLAAEEAAKALALHVDSILQAEERMPVDDLSNHRTKHVIAGVTSLMIHLGLVISEIVEAVQRDIDGGRLTEEHAGAECAKRMLATFEKIRMESESTEYQHLLWHRNANELKKKGLYVDWVHSAWHTPEVIDGPTYSKHRSHVDWWLTCVEKVLSIPIEQLNPYLREIEQRAIRNK